MYVAYDDDDYTDYKLPLLYMAGASATSVVYSVCVMLLLVVSINLLGIKKSHKAHENTHTYPSEVQ